MHLNLSTRMELQSSARRDDRSVRCATLRRLRDLSWSGGRGGGGRRAVASRRRREHCSRRTTGTTQARPRWAPSCPARQRSDTLWSCWAPPHGHACRESETDFTSLFRARAVSRYTELQMSYCIQMRMGVSVQKTRCLNVIYILGRTMATLVSQTGARERDVA